MTHFKVYQSQLVHFVRWVDTQGGKTAGVAPVNDYFIVSVYGITVDDGRDTLTFNLPPDPVPVTVKIIPQEALVAIGI